MKYLFDSNICIHFLRGKYNIIEKLNEVGIDNCAISEITLAELVFGAKKVPILKRIIYSLKNLLDNLLYYPYLTQFRPMEKRKHDYRAKEK